MNLQAFTVGPLQENCYLLSDAGQAVLIDPGDEAGRLLGALRALELTAVWLTHAHFDHVGALADVLDRFPVPVYLHPDDWELLGNAAASAAYFGLTLRQPDVTPLPLKHAQVLKVGGLEATCLYTPGHAPGHISFHVPAAGFVLAGDALFQGSVGRTDLPGGSHEQLLGSIRRELLTLPDETVVYPGHGPATTVGVEQRTNPFLV